MLLLNYVSVCRPSMFYYAYILEYQLICKASSYVLDDITEIVSLGSMSFNFNA